MGDCCRRFCLREICSPRGSQLFLIAATASASGKSTIFYLSPSTISLPFDGSDYTTINIKPRHLYSGVEISSHLYSEALETSRKFNLDVTGPRVLFCANSALDLILKSGANHHMEFKSVDGIFIFGDGRFSTVPDSRAAIFKDRSLGLKEKNQLMRFFKLVQEHFGSASTNGDQKEEKRRISEEDLESPFVNFLDKQRLLLKIKSTPRLYREFQDCPAELLHPPEDNVNSSLSFTLQICRVEDITIEGRVEGSVIHFHRARTVVVQSSGTISASGLGCTGGVGRGRVLSNDIGSGAGHGGKGGVAYGNTDLPCELGSGSGNDT